MPICLPLSNPWRSNIATVSDSEHHTLSVFLRDGEMVYLTYQTSDRGVENLGTTFSLLDLVPSARATTGG